MIFFKNQCRRSALVLGLIILSACLILPAAQAAETAKSKDISRLLELTKTAQYSLEGLAGMMALSIPEEFKPEKGAKPGYEMRLSRALTRVIWQDLGPKLMVRLAKIYDQVFSHRDIRVMIDFYSTPAGQKIVGATPQLTAQLQKASVDLVTAWAAEYDGPAGAEMLKARLTRELNQEQ